MLTCPDTHTHTHTHTHVQAQSARLQEVTFCLSQLVGSYDTHTLTEACRGLAESMHEGTGTRRSFQMYWSKLCM